MLLGGKQYFSYNDHESRNETGSIKVMPYSQIRWHDTKDFIIGHNQGP